jgi:hypothetical protein
VQRTERHFGEIETDDPVIGLGTKAVVAEPVEPAAIHLSRRVSKVVSESWCVGMASMLTQAQPVSSRTILPQEATRIPQNQSRLGTRS